VARGDRVLGAITLTDRPREDAEEAVARLERLGLSVSLLSGDHEGAVRLAARRAGIASASAGISPDGKLDAVRLCREAGETVLAAGDGVNDAACLAAADVGASMARGADVAIHASDLVIRSPRLSALPEAVALSRVTVRRIRQNLALAIGYNLVAIPLAAAGVLTPLLAAIAMSLSSVIVTGNAVRLLRWQPEP
ncbi:MAG: cation-translocating P-type ATPase, partial [Myxococcales bacterium]|nr:cation-translocating P-type ATPase [Myxococcales bacterium]